MNEFPDQSVPTAKRTLAAVVFTDIADFSARMGQNEDATLEMVHRDLGLIKNVCDSSGGKVLKTTGDGLLMYFDSAVQAVACSLQSQRALASQSQELPDEGILMHRIGIHLGDVFVSDNDVMGDGVNIAARLQAEAEPGGICISQTVYDVVKNRLGVKATYLGPRDLKNIAEAVPVYQILLDAQAGPVHRTTVAPKHRKVRKTQSSSTGKWILSIVAGAALLGLLAVLGVVLHKLLYPSPDDSNVKNIAITPDTKPAVSPQPTTVQVVIVHHDRTPSTTPSDSSQTNNDNQPTPPPPPPEPAGPTKDEIDAARTEYMAAYNFKGMLKWLEDNDLEKSPLYIRYMKLQKFGMWLNVSVRDIPKSKPLQVVLPGAAGSGTVKVWNSPSGDIVISGPNGETTVSEVRDLEPPMLGGIAAALIKRQPGAKLPLRGAVRIFFDECREAGLIEN